MKRSEFAEQLSDLMRTTKKPMTTRQMAEAVGCSAQRAYVWVKDNRGNLVAMGSEDTGGTLFVGRDNPLAPAVAVPVTGAGKGAGGRESRDARDGSPRAGSIEVGTQMTIRRLVLGDGVIVELETEDGRVIEATLHV